MTVPLIAFTNSCCGLLSEKEIKANKVKASFAYACLALDIIGTITFLVVGILAATKVIPLPPAGAYSMIGIAGLSLILWTILLTKKN